MQCDTFTTALTNLFYKAIRSVGKRNINVSERMMKFLTPLRDWPRLVTHSFDFKLHAYRQEKWSTYPWWHFVRVCVPMMIIENQDRRHYWWGHHKHYAIKVSSCTKKKPLVFFLKKRISYLKTIKLKVSMSTIILNDK